MSELPENRAEHANRKVHRERYITNYDPGDVEREQDYEPDYEAIMEARHERRRPDWA